MRILTSYIHILLFVLTTATNANSQPETDGMVLIPAFVFMMGTEEPVNKEQLRNDYSADEIPAHEVSLDSYYIDETEVTVGEYKIFLAAADRSAPRDPRFPAMYPWSKGSQPPDTLLDHPVSYINWYDADKYCSWKGKRLPTEAEWEFAARGNTAIIYPWGNKFNSEAANVKEKHQGGTLPVKSLESDKSSFGVYDMGGNIAEWTSSWYEAYPGSIYTKNNFNKRYKVIKGGSWVLPGKFYARGSGRSISSKPIKRHRGIGFRCASDKQ